MPPNYLMTSSLAPLKAYKDDFEALAEQVRVFSGGECGLLAVGIRHLTGWPIRALINTDGTHVMPVHYCNRTPSGELVDARGCYPARLGEQILPGQHNARHYAWTEDGLPFHMEDDDAIRLDAFLATDWMKAVVPLDKRVAPQSIAEAIAEQNRRDEDEEEAGN